MTQLPRYVRIVVWVDGCGRLTAHQPSALGIGAELLRERGFRPLLTFRLPLRRLSRQRGRIGWAPFYHEAATKLVRQYRL